MATWMIPLPNPGYSPLRATCSSWIILQIDCTSLRVRLTISFPDCWHH